MVKVIQIPVGGFDNNFSYLVLGEGRHSKECVLIDPTGNIGAIESEINKCGAKIALQLFTHLHDDHIELMGHFERLKVKSFKPKPGSLGSKEVISVAGMNIIVFHTPGHTKESVCFLIENNFFSGDTLFVRGIGTTAYGGNDAKLGETLDFLFTLNKMLLLWPGHNYGGSSSTLKEALKNSHIAPKKKALENIKKMVQEYRAKNIVRSKK